MKSALHHEEILNPYSGSALDKLSVVASCRSVLRIYRLPDAVEHAVYLIELAVWNF